MAIGIRIGSEAAKRLDTSGSTSAAGGGDLKAIEWDEVLPLSAEAEELQACWRERPTEWMALSEVGRQTLLNEMQGSPWA